MTEGPEGHLYCWSNTENTQTHTVVIYDADGITTVMKAKLDSHIR